MRSRRSRSLSSITKALVFVGVDLLRFLHFWLVLDRKNSNEPVISFWLPSPTFLPGLLTWAGLILILLERFAGNIGLLLGRTLFVCHLAFLGFFNFQGWTSPGFSISAEGILLSILPTAGLGLVVWAVFQPLKATTAKLRR